MIDEMTPDERVLRVAQLAFDEYCRRFAKAAR
jgi:hypothetical protein